MKKLMLGFLLIITALGFGYILGPIEKYEQVDGTPIQLTIPLSGLDDYIAKQEKAAGPVKPDNEARVIWTDSLRNKTEYSLVYLHGFEASWAEGHPIIGNLAERYGCNAYLSRISRQALIEPDALLDESPEAMIESAKQAIAIGKLIGEKVIVMSTSTGSTYSTYLAAHDPEIYALIMTSPNFDLYDQNSKMLTKPWGKKIFRQMMKGDYRQWEASEQIKYYWNDRYRIEGLIALRDLLDQTMIPEVWQQNKTPIFIGYYYKDETAQDKIISITAIHDFLDQIQTPSSQVRAIAYPDSPGHVIGSSYMNPHWESVQDSIYSFVEEVLQILPTQN